MNQVIVIAAVAVVVWLIGRVVKFGGLEGAMFGAQVERTVGEVTGSAGSFTKTVLRVHLLNEPPDRALGIELLAKGFSYRRMPVALSLAEARNLLGILQNAIGAR